MHQSPIAAIVITTSLLLFYLPIPSSLPPSLLVPLTFLLGVLFPSTLSRLASWLLERSVQAPHLHATSNGNVRRRLLSDYIPSAPKLYGLDHAILNVPSFTADSMWMNMGYWKVSRSILSVFSWKVFDIVDILNALSFSPGVFCFR